MAEVEGKNYIRVPGEPEKKESPPPEKKNPEGEEILKLCKENHIELEELKQYVSEKKMSPEIVPEPVKKPTRKFSPIEFETVNICDLIVIAVCGISLLIATHDRYNDVVYTIVGGFMGYLGGGARGLIRHQATTPTTTTSSTESTSSVTTTTKKESK